MHTRFFTRTLSVVPRINPLSHLNPVTVQRKVEDYLKLYPSCTEQDTTNWLHFMAYFPRTLQETPSEWSHPHPSTLLNKIALLKFTRHATYEITPALIQSTLNEISLQSKKNYLLQCIDDLMNSPVRYPRATHHALLYIQQNIAVVSSHSELVLQQKELHSILFTHHVTLIPAKKLIINFLVHGACSKETMNALQHDCYFAPTAFSDDLFANVPVDECQVAKSSCT